MADEANPQHGADSEPVTVTVARSRADWVGRREWERLDCDGPLAAGHWDERIWRRA